jgi:hypothetical protein
MKIPGYSIERVHGKAALLVCGLLLALSAGESRAQDPTVFNNLDQPYNGNYVAGDLVGNAILSGTSSSQLTNIVISERQFGPISGETFALDARNPDGTVGGVLFNNFSLSYSSGTGLETITPNTPFVFAPNTGYWLVLVSPRPGTGNPSDLVAWDYTPSTNYTSSNGWSLPSTNTSFFTFQGSTTYSDLSAGPQLFQVNVTAVPEPGPLALAGVAAVVGTGAAYLRRRRRPH